MTKIVYQHRWLPDGSDMYVSPNGETVRRECGETPNGNPVAGRWVLRDASGAWIDFHAYRHDLAEHYGISLSRDSKKEAA